MEQLKLGGSGIVVGDLGFGAMNFGFPGGPAEDRAVATVQRAIDASISLIDTAVVHTKGESERVVGLAIAGRRDKAVLVATFGLPMTEEPDESGGSPRRIKRAVEDSLRRLGSDYLDPYPMHRPDYRTDIDETLGALSDLVSEGRCGQSVPPCQRRTLRCRPDQVDPREAGVARIRPG